MPFAKASEVGQQKRYDALTTVHSNALIICFPVGRPLGHPRGTHGNPWGIVQFWYFFFPAGEGSCLALEMTSLNHGDIPTGFVRGSATDKVKSAPGTMVDMRKWAKSVQKLG